MHFSERKEFECDPLLFALKDTQVALRLTDEYYRKCSARPTPKFFEVDRAPGQIDPMWHMPTNIRTQFSREIEIHALNQFQKPKFTDLLKTGITYQRKDFFWLSHIALIKFDWWPLRGDQVFWNGFRYTIIHVDVPPEAYFGQTNVWTAIVLECVVPADGDAIPAFPKNKLQPAETQRDGLSTNT